MKKTGEKTIPRLCVCGKAPVTVRSRTGYMLTCPDPLNCSQNIRTAWHRSGGADSMIIEWNSLVEQAKYQERRRLK